MASPSSQALSNTGNLLASVVAFAVSKLGDEYVFGATGPNTFDCSGLTQAALKSAGWANAPRTSEEQWAWVQKISASDLQPGDLIFSQWPGDQTSPGHVAVYVGGGDLIEAPETGVPVHKIPLDANYKAHVVGYGRPPNSSTAGDTGADNSGNANGGFTPAFLTSDNPVLGFLGGGLVGGFTGAATGVGDVASAVGGIATEFGTLFHWMSWLFAPANWLRIGAGWIGTTVLIVGIYMLVKAAETVEA